MKQKGLAPILIVVLIAVALGGYLIYSQQTKPTPPLPKPAIVPQTPQATPVPSPIPNETTNWKTYTNTKEGYSVGYPKEVSLEEDPYGYGIWLDEQILISVSQKSWRNCKGNCPTIDSIEDIKIGNYQAKRIQGRQGNMIGSPGKFQIIEIENRGKFYTLRLQAIKKDNIPLSETADPNTEISKDETNLFNQILSTFKFIP